MTAHLAVIAALAVKVPISMVTAVRLVILWGDTRR